MIDWKNYKADEVKSGFDENGNRLFSLFAQDYQKVFSSEICPTCNDFPAKFQNFLNKTIMSNTESKFKLKKMYDGIPLEFGSNIHVTNANLTDELALQLANKHPRGLELFEVYPEGTVIKKNQDQENQNNQEENLNQDQQLKASDVETATGQVEENTTENASSETETTTENVSDTNTDANTSTLKVFEKDFPVEKVKSSLSEIGVKTNATTVAGIQKVLDGLSEENKEKLKNLIAE